MGIRDRIIAACRELAKTHGFSGFTVDELAQRAGVSKRTLYKYFRSKDEIVEATIDQFTATMGGHFDRLLASDKTPSEALMEIITILFQQSQFITQSRGLSDLRQYYPHLWAKIDAFRMKRIQSMVKLLIEKSDDPGVRSLNPLVISTVIVASIQAVLNPEFILSNNLVFEDVVRQVSQLYWPVIAPAAQKR
ncbi:MAG: TetR/AcrR family transcriptional regulator [Solirubrobacterales bacterium]